MRGAHQAATLPRRVLAGCALLWLATATVLSFAGEPAPAPPSAPKLPAWKIARDWQVVYKVSRSGESYGASYIARVYFREPDRLRIALAGDSSEICVADSVSVKWYSPEDSLFVWMPVGCGSEPWISLELDSPVGSPLASKEEARGIIEDAAAGKKGCYVFPPEEIAGRRCLVAKQDVHEYGAESPIIGSFTLWVDEEYGIPLAELSQIGRRTHIVRAQEVKINAGLSDRLFLLVPPRSARVVKATSEDQYELAICWDPDDGIEPDPMSCPSGLQEPVVVYEPTWLPPTFQGPSHYPGWSETTTEPTPPVPLWMIVSVWISRDGRMIEFRQGTEQLPRDLAANATSSSSLTVRGEPGRKWEYQQPFPRAILTWKAADRYHMLAGTEVSADDLLRLAESLKPVTVKPRD